MKYFLIEENSKYTQRPHIVNGYTKIDVRNICPENAYKLPKRELVFIEENTETVFTDIISIPFFLISEKIRKIIQMYDPQTMMRELVLLDKVYGKVERYYIPIFEEVDCVGNEGMFHLKHSEIKKLALKRDQIKDKNIFRIAGVEKQCIVGNLDIVESILKRGCLGIKLTELKCC